MNDEKYISIAIELANENVKNGNGGPFAAIIVKNGKIISTGVNSVTSENDPTAHAEISAIRKACKALNSYQLTDCEIYSSCEPCPMCLGAIYWSRPKKLIFAATKEEAAKAGFDDAFIYEEIEKNLLERNLNTIKFPLETRLEPFNFWMRKIDKIDY